MGRLSPVVQNAAEWHHHGHELLDVEAVRGDSLAVREIPGVNRQQGNSITRFARRTHHGL